MSLLIGEKAVVSMHYTLTDAAGEVVDSSDGSDPLTYLHGAGNIIPGLETALVGKTVGDSMKVVVQPEHGYGEIMPELIQVVDRASFEGVESIEAGMAFEASAEDGSARRIVVRDVEGDQVTIDGNHPLAGAELHFDVEIVTVRDATEEELSHGHAH
jgi:FKBP-type peptidyl-prolyl cis-trans isomerase SlyD